MSAPVEYAVEVDGVELPARRNSRNILVQTRDQSNVPRSGLGRHSCMRYAEGAMFQDARSQEGREGSRGQVFVCFRIRFGERLEGLVST